MYIATPEDEDTDVDADADADADADLMSMQTRMWSLTPDRWTRALQTWN